MKSKKETGQIEETPNKLPERERENEKSTNTTNRSKVKERRKEGKTAKKMMYDMIYSCLSPQCNGRMNEKAR